MRLRSLASRGGSPRQSAGGAPPNFASAAVEGENVKLGSRKRIQVPVPGRKLGLKLLFTFQSSLMMSYPSQWDAFSAVLKRHLTFRRFGRKIKIKGDIATETATGPQAHLFDIYFCVSQLEINSIHPKFFCIFFLFWQTPSMGSRWKLRKSVFCCDFGSLWMQHVVKATHTHRHTPSELSLGVFLFFFLPVVAGVDYDSDIKGVFDHWSHLFTVKPDAL